MARRATSGAPSVQRTTGSSAPSVLRRRAIARRGADRSSRLRADSTSSPVALVGSAPGTWSSAHAHRVAQDRLERGAERGRGGARAQRDEHHSAAVEERAEGVALLGRQARRVVEHARPGRRPRSSARSGNAGMGRTSTSSLRARERLLDDGRASGGDAPPRWRRRLPPTAPRPASSSTGAASSVRHGVVRRAGAPRPAPGRPGAASGSASTSAPAPGEARATEGAGRVLDHQLAPRGAARRGRTRRARARALAAAIGAHDGAVGQRAAQLRHARPTPAPRRPRRAAARRGWPSARSLSTTMRRSICGERRSRGPGRARARRRGRSRDRSRRQRRRSRGAPRRDRSWRRARPRGRAGEHDRHRVALPRRGQQLRRAPLRPLEARGRAAGGGGAHAHRVVHHDGSWRPTPRPTAAATGASSARGAWRPARPAAAPTAARAAEQRAVLEARAAAGLRGRGVDQARRRERLLLGATPAQPVRHVGRDHEQRDRQGERAEEGHRSQAVPRRRDVSERLRRPSAPRSPGRDRSWRARSGRRAAARPRRQLPVSACMAAT